MSLLASIDEIVPSPYQPRITFNLDDLRGSVQKDGILSPLVVRKVGNKYELIDGERRLRLAKELGLETVPVSVIDVSDEVARRMVWKVNTLRQDYTPQEKARYFKKCQNEGMSIRGIAREYELSEGDINAYLNVLKLPSDYQNMVWDRIIPLGVVRELGTLFNGATYVAPLNNSVLFEILDRAKKEKGFDFMQTREVLKPYLAKQRHEQVEATKEAIKKIPELPTKIRLKTPDDFDKAAKTLKAEAKKKREDSKTPAQLETEKAEKERKKQEKAEKTKLKKEDEKKAKEERERKIAEEAATKAREEEKRKAEVKIHMSRIPS